MNENIGPLTQRAVCGRSSLFLIAVLLQAAGGQGTFNLILPLEYINNSRKTFSNYSMNYIADQVEFNGGLFAELENDDLVFFSPKLYRKLREALNSSTAQFRCLAECYFYSPVSKSGKIKKTDIEIKGSIVTFDGHPIRKSSIERLQLSEGWNDVLKRDWYRACTITKIGDGLFFIAGGQPTIYADSDKEKEEPFGTAAAFVYNSYSKRIVKKFRLCRPSLEHSSICLPSGEILMIGGINNLGKSALIVNLTTGASRMVTGQLNFPRTDASLCLDRNDDVLIVGGSNSYDYSMRKGILEIERFSLKEESFKVIGTLKESRFFCRDIRYQNNRCNILECSSALARDGVLVVSGGLYHRVNPISRIIQLGLRKNAEIVSLPDP